MATIPSYTVQRSTRASQLGLVACILLVLLLLALPGLPFGGRAAMRTIVEIAYYLALAQMWNLLAGYAGLVSIGQQAFVGLGGYALFVMATTLGVNPLLAIPLAGLTAAVFAIPTAFVVFRLRGAYFAIGTWVVAEVYRLAFAQVTTLGGGSGMSLPGKIAKQTWGIEFLKEALDVRSTFARDLVSYLVALVLAFATIALVYWLLRSRNGLALTAIRDSEPASESLGVNNFRTKIAVYIAAAAMTGTIGALIFLQKLRISPDAGFSLGDWTASVIFIVVIGGIGTIEGPIIGTIIFFALRELLSDWGSWYLVIMGVIAVCVMLFAPQGVWGLIAKRYDIRFFPVQRRVILKGND